MHLLAPDILAEARGLPVTISGAGVVLGGALWLTGWRLHRFWIVLFMTLSAGVSGLLSGSAPGAQPLVSAVLLAIAAGALALDLSRVLAFGAGGLALWVAVHAVVPSWDQPLVCFVAGGLVALLVFRTCIMALSSLAGALLMVYSGFCLLDRLGKLDMVAWSGKQSAWMSWACIALALLGWLVQLLAERRRSQREEARLAQEKQIIAAAREKEKEAKAKEKQKDKGLPKKPWWGWEVLQAMRKAG
jgi:MFS family permease